METINKELASIFRDLAAIYSFDDGGNPFRANAYEQASFFLKGFNKDIQQYSVPEMEELEGIGKSIALKIQEYIDTGKIKKYEEMKEKYPLEFIRLSFIGGIGSKTLKKIYDEYDLKSKAELIEALQDGRIEKMDGFGAKKVSGLLDRLTR
ncbi:MAG: hypothetical protein HKN92_05770 [Chitinophagales bacterium]|nr:hypothetical protein [Chitinophagales bacterium]